MKKLNFVKISKIIVSLLLIVVVAGAVAKIILDKILVNSEY